MLQRIMRFAGEGSILVLVLLLFKTQIFPFFIQLWYPTGEHMDKMRDLIFLIVGIITIFIYIGLGSCSRNDFQLSWTTSILVFLLWHFPLLFSDGLGFAYGWQHLLSDLFALLIPSLRIDALLILGIYLLLFLLGRTLNISESMIEEDSSPKMFSKVFSYSNETEKNN